MRIFLVIISSLFFHDVNAQAKYYQVISTKADTINIDMATVKVFTKAEHEPEFPGGKKAWDKFMEQNLERPLISYGSKKKMKGKVFLQFVVLEDGTVGDVEGIYGDEVLQEAAIRLMKKTPNWIPASQNGKTVISYKKWQVIFD